MKIFLDMDGVLADFDGAMLKRGIYNKNDFIHKPRSTWTEDEAKLSAAVEKVMAEPGFWSSIPLMPGAHKLFNAAWSLSDVKILTARPNIEGSEWVATEKRVWIRGHFPTLQDKDFICCLRTEKVQYAFGRSRPPMMDDKPNILIDDMERNCYEWEEAGGKAILFKSMDQAIFDLKKAVDAA